jgi:NADP-dependent 3-hydroxy acid dehydrogenase YdfG
MNKTDLDGRVVAITGAAQGIGLAIAQACSAAGMKVVVGDLAADAVDKAAASLGGDAHGFVVDVRDRSSFADFLDSAEAACGPLDVLVNNAGVLRMGPLATATPEDVQLQVDVNLNGVITGTQLALERFLPLNAGHIVNMASSAAMIATANGAVYSATKHAVLGLSRALRGELRGTGVRTTIVMPGVIRTEMTKDFGSAVGVRVVEPADVADAIVAALRTGRAEVCVPAEIALQGRLFTNLPARTSDLVKHALRADRVMH